MIYFVAAGDNEAVKIGYTSDLVTSARLTFLQVGNHRRLSVLRTVEGGPAAERWLHKHFAALHLTGEWFSHSPEMLSIELPSLSECTKAPGKKRAITRLRDARERVILPPAVGRPPKDAPIRERALWDIDRFLAASELSEHQFGIAAVNDHKFIPKLRNGGHGTRLTTIEKACAFMDLHAQEAAA